MAQIWSIYIAAARKGKKNIPKKMHSALKCLLDKHLDSVFIFDFEKQ